MKITSRRLMLGAKVLLAGGLLVYIYHSGLLRIGDLSGLVSHPALGVGALALLSGSIIIAGLRWGCLIRAQGMRISNGKSVAAYYAGMFISQFLWGGMSGDAYRVYHLIRQVSDNKGGATLSVMMDRLLGLSALLTLGLSISIFHWKTIFSHAILVTLELSFATLLVMMIVLLVAGLFFSDFILERWMSSGWEKDVFLKRVTWKLFQAAALYRRQMKVLWIGWFLSFLVHFFALGALILVALALNLGSLGVSDYLLVTPWAQLINYLPLTPGGLGVGEGAFAKLCQLVEPFPPSSAAYASIFLALRAVGALATLPGAAVHFLQCRQDTLRGDVHA